MTDSKILIIFSLFVLGLVAQPTDQPNSSTTDNTLDSFFNRTAEIFHNIYDPVADSTQEYVANITDGINKFSQSNESAPFVEQAKNCSIVVGGALAGAVIGSLAVGLGAPLVLCLIGFTCWGIMAGSCAACCQSSIGNVPANSCFSCLQSLGAGGGIAYVVLACVVGIPVGLYVGGFYTNTYFHCFPDWVIFNSLW